MKARWIGVVALLVIAGVVLYFAFGRARPPFQPSTAAEEAMVNTMESDLTGLAQQESFYYRAKGRFTPYPESTYVLRSVGVSIPKVSMRDSGYYAVVTHSGLPGVQCAIAVGTKNPLDGSAKEAVPACR
jgi:hypothetical protein